MDNELKEVYVAYSNENTVLYVGQGNIGRHKHCKSGISHNKELNRYYFLNGEDSSMKVNIIQTFNNTSDALLLEKELIKSLNPLFNSVHNVKEDVDCGINTKNFTHWSKAYYEAFKHDDIGTVEYLQNSNRKFYEIVETIGIDEIKNTGFHKTKSKAKYKKIVGINSISSSKSKAYKNLKLKSGGFYTYSEIKDKIQECFDKLGLKSKAKATDIKQVFNVKRTTRSGVEGYLIGDKI